MTHINAPRIAELLASRICHDLVGSVGAICNGVELITEFGENMEGDAMQLIASSADQTARRIAVFRLAYGAGGADPHTKLVQVGKILSDFFLQSHVAFSWDSTLHDLQDGMRRGMAKTIANAVLLASECLGGPGQISVTRDTSHILVRASGERLTLREGTEDAFNLKTSPDNLDARLIQPYITKAFADQYNISLIWKWQGTNLEIRIA